VIHEILISAFVIITTPVTMMLLTRAALLRDRMEQAERNEEWLEGDVNRP